MKANILISIFYASIFILVPDFIGIFFDIDTLGQDVTNNKAVK